MATSRREFLKTVSALMAIGVLPRAAQARWRAEPALHFANKPLPGGSFVIGELTSGGNVLTVPSAIGPIIVDAKFAHTAPDLASDVESLMKAKPVLLIDTHHHADHSGGNWVFHEKANVIAHKNFNPRIENNLAQYRRGAESHVDELKKSGADEATVKAAAELAEKIKGLKADQFTAKQELIDGPTILNHGGVAIHCYHYGNGHTDNDLVVYFPALNVLHVGDLLFNNLHPYIDRSAKANTRGWQNSLREAMKIGNEKTIVIPGHGEVTDKSALPKQIEYFDRMRDIVAKAMKDGKTKDEITALKPDEFKDYGFEQIRPVTLSGIYEELKEEQP